MNINKRQCFIFRSKLALYNADPAIAANFVDDDYYWSSTEFSGDPSGNAWYQHFVSSGSSQGAETKDFSFSVRCSRGV